MADLSTVTPRGGSRPQDTFHRQTTMPRPSTDLPGREVNAPIVAPRGPMENAAYLTKLLSEFNNSVQDGVGVIQQKQDANAAGAATLDHAAGTPNDKLMHDSHVYRETWEVESAKSLGITISQEVTDAVNNRLADSDHPATMDDINKLIEDTYRAHLTDANGVLLPIGGAKAQATLGSTLASVRAGLLPQAAEAIKKQTDAQTINTIVFNEVHGAYAGVAGGAPEVDPAKPLTVDPLAPLPAGQDAPRPVSVNYGVPTGKLPVAGTITNTFVQHEKRGSAGLDIAVPAGTSVEAPAGGKVIAVGSDGRSGNFVKIDHGNGVVSSYAHLSAFAVKKGDIVRPGQRLGASGSTGHSTGPHLHYRVRVDGKDVDPQTFVYSQHTGTSPVELASDVQVDPLPAATPAPVMHLNFEAILAKVPPTVNRGEAKRAILKALINEADSRGDARILDGIAWSTQADGKTPSLSPDEQAAVIDAQDRIANKARVEADRVKNETQEKNANAFMTAFVDGQTPSNTSIRAAVDSGAISATFGYSLINHIESEAKQAEREQKAEERIRQATTDAEIDQTVASMIAMRSTGNIADASAQDDHMLFASGQLGEGKKAAARLRSLRAAAAQGEKILMSNPDVAMYSGMITDALKPKAQKGGSMVEVAMGHTDHVAASRGTYLGAMAKFKKLVAGGMDPAEAYAEVMKSAKPSEADAAAARRARIAQLRNKELGR